MFLCRILCTPLIVLSQENTSKKGKSPSSKFICKGKFLYISLHGFTATSDISFLGLCVLHFFFGWSYISLLHFLIIYVKLEQDMQQFQRYYKSGTCTIQNRFPQGVTSTNTVSHKYSFSKPKSKAEAKQVAAKKHSEAERRHRMRIYGQ